MSRFYVICSKPDCVFNKTDEYRSIKFCPLCGSIALKECPHCHMPITERGEFCSYCGRNLKEPAQHEEEEQLVEFIPPAEDE